MRNMKKLFAILFALVMLSAGCAKIEDSALKNEKLERREIVFKTSTTATKAIVNGTAMVDNFGVYGYVTGAGVQSAAYAMSNAKYLPAGTPADGGKYYWPKSDNPENVNVLFTAYSQYVASPSFSDGTLTLSIPTLTQALIDTPADFNDVLYAQTNANHQDAEVAHASVPLHFKHALSWIEFQGKVDDNTTITEVEITSIKFNGGGLYTTGSLVLDTKSLMTSPAVSGQATQNAALDFGTSTTKTLTGDDLNKSSYSVISDALVVPQAVPASVTITFNIKIQNTTGNEVYYVGRTITRTINTGNDANDHAYVANFEAGKKYIYKVFVTVDGIDFTVDVIDWTSDTFQVWDHNATAYVEHFFDKASTQMGLSLAIA
jgi:hypothetical protein